MNSLYGQLGAGGATDPLVAAAAAAALANDPSLLTGSGSRDTTFTKIFVGGLPYHTSDKTLHEYFEQFGEIEEAVVITDRQTQKSRGYGFVTMKDRAAAERACKDPNPIIDGRKANVNLAYLGAKPRGNIQLAALSTGIQQLPLQTQLQALFPARIGLPQALYYPSQLVNPLALGAAPAPTAQPFLDYSALAAAVNSQNTAAFALHPAVSAAGTGLEQYAYAPYGVLPGGFPLQATQLASTQTLENQRV